MTSINTFDVNVYSEETHSVTESEYDEVMSLMAEDDSAWQGYAEWSRTIEATDAIVEESENFIVTQSGKVHYKGAALKSNRIGGIEI